MTPIDSPPFQPRLPSPEVLICDRLEFAIPWIVTGALCYYMLPSSKKAICASYIVGALWVDIEDRARKTNETILDYCKSRKKVQARKAKDPAVARAFDSIRSSTMDQTHRALSVGRWEWIKDATRRHFLKEALFLGAIALMGRFNLVPDAVLTIGQLFSSLLLGSYTVCAYKDRNLYRSVSQIHAQPLENDPRAKAIAVRVLALNDGDDSSPVSVLPQDMRFKILLHLDYRSMCRMGQVSKQWNIVANDSRVWKQTLFCYHPDLPLAPSYLDQKEKEVCKVLLMEPDDELGCLDIYKKEWFIKINDQMTVFLAKALLAASMKNGITPERINFYQNLLAFRNDQNLRQELGRYSCQRDIKWVHVTVSPPIT
jgi:hypothetical protein